MSAARQQSDESGSGNLPNDDGKKISTADGAEVSVMNGRGIGPQPSIPFPYSPSSRRHGVITVYGGM